MKFVDLNAQHASLEPQLRDAIDRVIADSAFVRGKDVEEFEEHYADLIGIKHCISCANGTDAIYIALRALGAGPGDEVITTAHSWIATSETITQTGARVVFSDTDDSFCLDPALIEAKITPRTRGIVVVHLFGQPADMDSIMAIARKNGLWVIEDCAQAHLAQYGGRTVGTIGDIATFSFYPGKNLGAMGDAGCIVTNRDDLAEFAALFARHGGKNNHVMEGICSRMDGLQAAVLNIKMTRLPKWNGERQRLAARYDSGLPDIPDLKRPTVRERASHVYHLYVIRVPQRDHLKAHLAAEGIPTVINYPQALPNYSAYAYLGHGPEDFPVATRHASDILSLPIHPFLSNADQDRVIAVLQSYFAADSQRVAEQQAAKE